MTPTLLVLTDFLAASNHALDYATQLAQRLAGQLVLLHVHRNSLLDPERFTGKLPDSSEEATRLALDKLTRRLPVPAVAELGAGRVEDAVQAAVERHHPALVVLSRPQESPTPDELMTTTALTLLRVGACPLLVMPPEAGSATLPAHVLLAADGGPFNLGKHAAPVAQLLAALEARLTIVHVTASATRHTAPQARETVERAGLAAAAPVVRTCHVCQADPAQGILDAIREQRGDMLAVIARPHTMLGRLFHRSVTAQLVLHSPVPVLVLPTEQPLREGTKPVQEHLLAR